MSTAIVIAAWPRNQREMIQVCLDRFAGADTIDIRAWYVAPGGELKPTRVGLTVAIKHLVPLSETLSKALVEARARGLLEPEEAGHADGE